MQSSPPPPPPPPLQTRDQTPTATKTLSCLLFTTSLFSLLFIITTTTTTTTPINPPPTSPSPQHPLPAHHKKLLHHPSSAPPPPPPPPSVAYLLSGSHSDAPRLLRLLLSLYHPRNHYLLHLDRTAHQSQRDHLALSIQAVPAFRFFQNVNVVGRPDFANPRGGSALSSALRGAAILLRCGRGWDWFVHLSAGHYPLVTQDDLLHILSFQPKELNFVNHSSYIGWRESRRLKPIIVDPGLYLSENSDVFYGTQKRLLPSVFRLFTGSASAIFSRKFIEFCILGTDNLPRTVLMYLSNTLSAHAKYFQTVLCNSREFKRTVINHNLQYSSGDELPNSEKHRVGSNDFNQLIQSGAAFASQFTLDDPVLDQIDREVLNRKPGRIAPGGWCLGDDDEDPCKVWGDSDILRPGPGARRLERLMVDLLSNDTFLSQRCKYE